MSKDLKQVLKETTEQVEKWPQWMKSSKYEQITRETQDKDRRNGKAVQVETKAR